MVIAPLLCEALNAQAEAGDIKHVDRIYHRGDLAGAFLVIAATDDARTNAQVYHEAQERNLLINVVDDPVHCNYIAPSVVRRGPLTLAISTSGACPALSRHIRKELERDFGSWYSDYVDLLSELRAETMERLTMHERRVFWRELFDSDVRSLVSSGNHEQARRRAEAILWRHLPGEN